MWRKAAFLLLSLLLVPGWAHAHGGHGPVAHSQTVRVGPYAVDVEHTEWPARAIRGNPIFFVPQGGTVGKSARVKVIFVGKEKWPGFMPIGTYPGVQDAWAIQEWYYPMQGEWAWEIEVDGPLGKAVGRTEPMLVGPPPGMPQWLGWLVGLTPLWGLIWFMVREIRRTRVGAVHAATR